MAWFLIARRRDYTLCIYDTWHVCEQQSLKSPFIWFFFLISFNQTDNKVAPNIVHALHYYYITEVKLKFTV